MSRVDEVYDAPWNLMFGITLNFNRIIIQLEVWFVQHIIISGVYSLSVGMLKPLEEVGPVTCNNQYISWPFHADMNFHVHI